MKNKTNFKRKIFVLLALICVLTTCAGVACSNGGTEFYVVTFELGYDSAESFTQKVVAGDIAQEPAYPKRDGYEFLGWYEYGQDQIESDVKFDFLNTKINKNVTLRAKWGEPAKDMPRAPEDVTCSFSEGVLTVSAPSQTEFSFNDGPYSSENTYTCGYGARVKVSVRMAETLTTAASEPNITYYTSIPDITAFSFSSTEGNALTVSVENPDVYEYLFEGRTEWETGTEFSNLENAKTQTLKIRVRAEGNYRYSATAETTVEVKLGDGDVLSRVGYIWGNSEAHSTISINTDAIGLNGEDSTQSILIHDKDITGFNDWTIIVPNGYARFSVDIKVVMDDTNITKALSITNSSGRTMGVIELNKWQSFNNISDDWLFTLNFPSLSGVSGEPKGTADIYLDNIRYYTAQEVQSGILDTNRWVADSIGTGDGDAITDMKSKFDITLGATTSSYKNYKEKYCFANNTDSANVSHAIKIVNPLVKNVSGKNGVSFAVDMQCRGTVGTEAPIYLLKKGVTLTASELAGLSDFSDDTKFIKIHAYKVEAVGDTFNGAEIVKITTEQLTVAGYDLTDIGGLTIVYRDAPAQTSGWLNLLNLFLYDFKVY